MKGKDSSGRLYFVDNLRVVVISLVVAHHAGQAYGPTGGRWPLFDAERSALLGPFFAVNAAFFMGLLFLLSGYFVPHSCDRKGVGKFLKDRILRLGVPLVFMAFVVFAPIMYLMDKPSGSGQLSFWHYFIRVYIGKGQVEVGHMWFVAQLLLYTVGYVLWRLLFGRVARTDRAEMSVPGHWGILAYAIVLAVAGALVRTWYPIDRWVRVLPIVPIEVAHLPQYLSLFVIGIVASRRDWLRRLPTATGMTWLWIGLAAAAAHYALSLGGWGLVPESLGAAARRHWSHIWSVWEAFICVGLCVGLIVLFRERLNRQGKLLRGLSRGTYTVYIIHFLVVVSLQFTLAQAALPPFAKFALVVFIGVPLCFGLAHLIRKLPLARRIL